MPYSWKYQNAPNVGIPPMFVININKYIHSVIIRFVPVGN